MSSAVGWVTKGLDVLTGADQQKQANKLSRRALDIQSQQYAARKATSALLQKVLARYKGAGGLDADARIARSDKEANRELDRSLQSAAAADAVAGDHTAATVARRDSIVAEDYDARQRRNDAIRDNVAREEMQLTAAANPDFQGSADAYSQTLLNTAGQIRADAPDPTGFAMALQGFLNRRKRKAGQAAFGDGSSGSGYGQSQVAY